MELILTSVDVKNLKTYQQLYLYFIPMFTNLGFINIVVVIARLYWFEKSIERNGESFTAPTQRSLAHAFGTIQHHQSSTRGRLIYKEMSRPNQPTWLLRIWTKLKACKMLKTRP
jgi:hypothetical protein